MTEQTTAKGVALFDKDYNKIIKFMLAACNPFNVNVGLNETKLALKGKNKDFTSIQLLWAGFHMVRHLV